MKRIFIVGVGRSGTSLLQSMLNAHSSIAFFPETQFLRNYVWKSFPWKGKDSFLETLRGDEVFSRLGIFEDSSFKSTLEYYNIISSVYLSKKGKTVIGDKDPRNIEFLEELGSTFSGSTIVHISRDPRDVVLSRTKAKWSQHWPFIFHAFIYEAQILKGYRATAKLKKSKLLEIKYEALLQNPARELTRVLKEVDLPFEPTMLSFKNSSLELVDKSEVQWKKETLEPLLTGNSGKWRHELSPFQNALVEAICRNSMLRNGYEFSNNQLSWHQHLAVHLALISFRMIQFIYPLRSKFL